MIRRGGLWTGACLIALAMSVSASAAQERPAKPAPKTGTDLVQHVKDAQKPENISTTLEIVLAVTVLSVAPAILVMMTSFTRIVIVLSFVRRAMATPEMPPNPVLIGLSLFLTGAVMQPVARDIHAHAIAPYQIGRAHV